METMWVLILVTRLSIPFPQWLWTDADVRITALPIHHTYEECVKDAESIISLHLSGDSGEYPREVMRFNCFPQNFD
jgi:hypothetical protein